MFFAEFAPQFLDISQADGNSPGELAQKDMALRNHLVPFFGNMLLEDIAERDVRAYVKQKRTEEYADKTINNHLGILSRVLSVAKQERVAVMPDITIKLLTLQFSETRFLDEHEIDCVLRAAQFQDKAVWYPMVVFALHTGLRIGEMLALDWADIDMVNRRVTVSKSACRVSKNNKGTKTNKRRMVSLTDTAIAALESLPVKQGYVWPVSYDHAYKAINRIAEVCDLEDVGWHTLRHSFASLLVSKGVPPATVSKLLGHASLRMTERYLHLSPSDNAQAVAVLNAAIGRAAS